MSLAEARRFFYPAAFADPRPVSIGVGGKKGTRNSPTVINAAYNTTQFWDGRSPTLEKQAEEPVQNSVEMVHTLEDVERKLMADPSYREQFKRAFGADLRAFLESLICPLPPDVGPPPATAGQE